MNIQKQQFTVSTSERFEITQVTDSVQKAIADADASEGVVFASTAHTTAVLSINEYEERLMNDMVEKFEELVPPEDGYTHDRHHIATDTQLNAHAHMICAMLQSPLLRTFSDGEIDLGTWEEALLFEVDGPNERSIDVTILS